MILDSIIAVILSETGLTGAIALLFIYLFWKSEKKVERAEKLRDDRILKIEADRDKKVAGLEKLLTDKCTGCQDVSRLTKCEDRVVELEKERSALYDQRIKDGGDFRSELKSSSSAELARQTKQMEMYHEFSKTLDELVDLIERWDDDRRRGK